jgi:hypothetical protein
LGYASIGLSIKLALTFFSRLALRFNLLLCQLLCLVLLCPAYPFGIRLLFVGVVGKWYVTHYGPFRLLTTFDKSTALA